MTSKSSGKVVRAIVLDYSAVGIFSSNIGDVSQAVIDEFGGVPHSGHISLQSCTFSNTTLQFDYTPPFML